jgi:hypothetical protein
MFTVEEIQARVRTQPFVPLRIVTSSGQFFDVYHPDLIMIGRRSLEVGTASADNPTVYEHVTRVAIMHVTALQGLPAQPSQAGNGQK